MSLFADQGLPEREGGKAVLLVIVGLVLLFGGAYVAAHLLADQKLPRDTTIQGVDVGGKTPQNARIALAEGLRDAAERPMRLSIDGKPVSIDPVTAGLGVDYAASVNQVPVSSSWDPRALFDYYTGSNSYAAVPRIDDAALTDALTSAAGTTSVAAINGAITFRGSSFVSTSPVTGHGLDVTSAMEQVKAAYLTGDPVVLTTTTTQPAIGDAAVQQAIDAFANPAVSAPVTLRFGGLSIRLSPSDYLPAITMVASGHQLVPKVDAAKLKPVLDANIAGDGKPVDASFKVVNGKVALVPSRPGVSYDLADVAAMLPRLVAAPDGHRTGTVKATVAEAAFSTADATKLGIKQVVSTFTTYFPFAEYRNINLPRAASLVNGTVLKPGATFSLNQTVGERTRANGFTTGWTIRDGQYFEDLGGGVSQIATTTFNAAFFAGMTDIQHQPHSFYIDRYPEGREATVAWPSLDLKFRNDTPYGVYIQEQVTKATPTTSGVVTVTMYSTKYWNITATKGPRTNVVAPTTLHQSGASCYAHSGYPGFDVQVHRLWHKVGSPAVVRDEVMTTHYDPEDAVVCS